MLVVTLSPASRSPTAARSRAKYEALHGPPVHGTSLEPKGMGCAPKGCGTRRYLIACTTDHRYSTRKRAPMTHTDHHACCPACLYSHGERGAHHARLVQTGMRLDLWLHATPMQCNKRNWRLTLARPAPRVGGAAPYRAAGSSSRRPSPGTPARCADASGWEGRRN